MQYFYNRYIDFSGYMRIIKAYRAKHKQTKHILGGTKKWKKNRVSAQKALSHEHFYKKG